MSLYFKNIPDLEYIFRGNDTLNRYVKVKNLFKRLKLRDDIFQNLVFFNKYEIVGDERPDNVAYKLYNDETLDWLVLICNNIINIQSEWPLAQKSYENYLIEKYSPILGMEKNFDLIGGIKGIIKSIGITNSTALVGEADKSYSNVSGNGGDGSGATFEVSRGNIGDISNIVVVTGGYDYNVGKTLTIDGSDVGGSSGTDDIIFTITSTTSSNEIKVVKGTQLNDVEGAIYSVIHHYETKEIRTVLNNVIVPAGLKVDKDYKISYYDPDLGDDVERSANVITPITNYEFEDNLENKKRTIYVLKKQYLGIVLRDIEDQLPYKPGGTQFINKTLKRVDDIKITE
jgi:hypothetical protein